MSDVSLLGPAEIRSLAALLNVSPTKKLGQNFVIDANTVRRIVRLAGVEENDVVIEVGPGLGSLTLGLLEAGARVLAIEIDGRLAQQLPSTVAEHAQGVAELLTVIHADALEISELPNVPDRVVANLPYNVSVPVLLHLLEHVPSLKTGVVMVQAEVGQRIAAGPGSKVYGAPSVKASWYGTWNTLGSVSRQVFWPVPNVDSILVGFVARNQRPGDEDLRRRTFALVDAAFQQRRKTLRQSLANVFGGPSSAEDALTAAGIPSIFRGEQLSLDEFVRLAES